MDDFLLILKMKQGDEEALEKFVRKYYAQILQYCRYHCFDAAEAEDLTQETFLRFFGSLAAYQHMGKVRNYLYTIAGNLCKNFAKKKALCLVEQEVLDAVSNSEDEMGRMETKVYVENALKQLSEEFREVIILYYFQECKLREIAEILQIGLPLVKYRLKRGKEELKRFMGKEDIDGTKGRI